MTAKFDTQAPERLDLYFTHGKPLMKAAENGRYVRSTDYDALRDLADARAAAAAQAMREAAKKIAAAAGLELKNEHGRDEGISWGYVTMVRIDALPIPAAALDRLIAERVREAVEAEREACITILDDLYRCLSCGTTFLKSKGHYDDDCPKDHASWDGASEEQKIAAIRARKEGQS